MTSFNGSRVFMLGLDGLSRTFMQSPIVQESMPTLRTFLDRTRLGTLLSTVPPYTGPAWTTITSGLNPGKHGVFGFTDRTGRPVSDRDVSAQRVWDRLGEVGGRALVVNVPLTHPPRPIEGSLVAGMPAPAGRAFTYPESLAEEIENVAPGYVIDVSIMGSPRVGRTMDNLEKMTVARGRALTHLLRREDWDMALAVFILPDRLGHAWWKYLVPGSSLYETRKAARVRSAARATLQALDNAIEDALAALPSGTLVVLCSDHGFGPLDADLFFDVELAHAGLLSAPAPSRLRRMVTGIGRSRVASLLPRALLESVKRGMERPDSQRVAWTAPKFEHAVRLADPGDEAVEKQVVELLNALRSPTGQPLVRQVKRRAEIFEGPEVQRAPELFPIMDSETVELHEGFHSDTWLSRERSPWGTHAREGVYAIDTDGPLPEKAEAADIGATLLGALGIAIEGLDGRSLVEREVVHRLSSKARSPADTAGYDKEDEAAIFEHLRGLGYVE